MIRFLEGSFGDGLSQPMYVLPVLQNEMQLNKTITQ